MRRAKAHSNALWHDACWNRAVIAKLDKRIGIEKTNTFAANFNKFFYFFF